MRKILLLDNFDSFTYNIYQELCGCGCDVTIARNNAITPGEIEAGGFSAIVISPGPGSADNIADFGVCRDVILSLGGKIPILGICLGHQGIISAFGGRVSRAPRPMHGKESRIEHNSEGLFEKVPQAFRAMRYHSLAGEKDSIPQCLEVTAKSMDDGAIMGVRHRELPIFGVQFHPESVTTEHGKRIFENFLNEVAMHGR